MRRIAALMVTVGVFLAVFFQTRRIALADEISDWLTQAKAAEATDLKLAESTYSRVITVSPRHAPSYLRRGIVRLKLGKSAEADRDFKRAVELEPNLQAEVEAARQS